MMVKKFDEYINELWSKGLNRSKSNETRLGDIDEFNNYVKNINWVDLGHRDYLFAEYDYSEPLTPFEIEEHQKKLPKGVYLLGIDISNWISDNLYDRKVINTSDLNCLCVGSKLNDDAVYFYKKDIDNPESNGYYLGLRHGVEGHLYRLNLINTGFVNTHYYYKYDFDDIKDIIYKFNFKLVKKKG